jgi:hypothetical protein
VLFAVASRLELYVDFFVPFVLQVVSSVLSDTGLEFDLLIGHPQGMIYGLMLAPDVTT